MISLHSKLQNERLLKCHDKILNQVNLIEDLVEARWKTLVLKFGCQCNRFGLYGLGLFLTCISLFGSDQRKNGSGRQIGRTLSGEGQCYMVLA